MDRAELLEKITAGRTQLETALNGLQPEQMTGPGLHEGWSVKDLLAHLGWWEQRAVEIYEESMAGGAPKYVITNEEVDALNARVLEAFRPRDLEDVRAFERRAFLRLIEVVENAPDRDLFDPHRFPWAQDQPFYLVFEWNTYGHYDEHIASLRALALKHTGEPAVMRKGVDFLAQAGRDIDRAMADYAFHGISAVDVLQVLARYQNPDGGFTGLEFDIASPVSNPFAAELALRVMGWIDPPRDHPVVRRLVAHLEETQDEDGCWRFTHPVYEDALAPWFAGWQWPNLNPSGQIAGSLKLLGLGSERLHARVAGLFERLAKPADLAAGEYYQVLPYGLYFQTEWDFPQAELLRYGVIWWLLGRRLAGELDATHFFELASRPTNPIAARLPESVLAARLDQLAGEQAEDGGWPTPYDPHWRPWITACNLLILKAYGRLEGVI